MHFEYLLQFHFVDNTVVKRGEAGTKGPFKNYVIPLLKVVFGCMCAKEGAFAAMMMMQVT